MAHCCLENTCLVLSHIIHWILAIVCFPLTLPLIIWVKVTTGKFESKKDLSGKTAIVTGANSGIGYDTALDFARRNAHVILAGRSLERSEAAADTIRSLTNNSGVVAWQMDVSIMSSVRAFVERFNQEEDRLDILVNNAGIGSGSADNTRTEEGLEKVMATNHFGHFLLTNLLLDKLKKSAPSRVVNVSSMAHERAVLDIENVNSEKKFDGMKIYGISKLCNVLFTHELARRTKDSGVTAYSLHPGVVRTSIFNTAPCAIQQCIKSTFCWFKSSEQGAATSIYCALADDIEPLSGSYFSDCKLRAESAAGKNEELAKKLWTASEDITTLKNV